MLAGLHDLFEFASEGLTVVDTLDGYVAFRSLVQPDGDICVLIDPRALTRPDFVQHHEAHLEQIDRELRAHNRRLRRWTITVGGLGPAAILVLLGASWGTGLFGELLLGELMTYVQLLGVAALGLCTRSLSLSLLRTNLAQRQVERACERLGDAIARCSIRGD